MKNYLVKRAVRLIFVLFGVSVITFALTGLIRGNPAEVVLLRTGMYPTLEEIAQMEAQMGLDTGIFVQYLTWLGSALRLDFGLSFISRRPVVYELALRLPATLRLSVLAFLLMIVLSVGFSVLSVIACKRQYILEKLINATTFAIMGVPGFVLGTLLMYFISVRLGLLPMTGELAFGRYVLPVITLALPMACQYIRLIRANLLEELSKDYVITLRSMGVRESRILFRFALKNVFVPIVNLLGLSFGALIGGAVVVESIFSWPGLGSYLMISISTRDYPVVIAYVLLMAVFFVVINFIVDILAFALDVRIRHEA